MQRKQTLESLAVRTTDAAAPAAPGTVFASVNGHAQAILSTPRGVPPGGERQLRTR